MSLPIVRSAFVVSMISVGVGVAILACGGEQAGTPPPGAPILAPSAHPSPDPPPAVPLIISAPDASDADGEAGP